MGMMESYGGSKMELVEDMPRRGANIKVIGVGGGGGNAIDTMIDAGIDGVQFISANTDAQALLSNHADVKIQLGVERTKGLGAGANPTVGQEAAQESATQIQEYLKQSDMVFVTAGMGGGTGTGAAPVIASLARQLGALTVGVVTKPFRFEGGRRRKQADEGIERLRKCVDTLITIPNERLRSIAGEQMTMVEAFRLSNSVLVNAVRSISMLVTKQGYINLDFADVVSVMTNKGFALMGTGIGEGEKRAVKAAEEAINSPLLDNVTIDGAASILVNVTGPSNLTLDEVYEAMDLIDEAADENANTIFGVVFDDESEAVKVTIIATEFKNRDDGKDEAAASGASSSGLFNAAPQSGNYFAQPGPVHSVGSGSYAGVPVYQETLSSGSYPPADLARRMQEYDAQSDSLYNNNGGRQPASYAPAPSPDPAPMPDIYAPMGAVGAPGASHPAAASGIPKSSDSGVRERVPNSDSIVDNLLPDEDEIDNKPAYLRRNASKRNFLDF